MSLSRVTSRVARVVHAHRRAAAWATGAVAMLVLAACFDATWWRPLIQHYIEQRSGRQVSFDDLDVGWAPGAQVRITLRGLRVQNAPWARAEPLVAAGRLQMDFSWRSLWADQFIITRLTLVDAQVDLARQADGLRNWRLTRPNDRGPGRVQVQAVDTLRTQARITDGVLGLDLGLTTTELPVDARLGAAETGAGALPPLVRHVSLSGSRRGTAFKADVDVSEVVTLIGTGQHFALQGVLTTSQGRLAANGLAGDVATAGSFYQGLWAFEGRGLGELLAVLGPDVGNRFPLLSLPAKAKARLEKQGGRWALSGLVASMGRSDLAGELTFVQASASQGGAPRESRLQGTLRSQRLDAAELRQATPGGGQAGSAFGSGLHADIDWQVQRLAGLPPAEWEDVRTRVTVRGRGVVLSPLKFSVWGAGASGRIQVDSSTPPLQLAAELQVPAMPLVRLAGGKLAGQGVAGDLALQLSLSARGDSAQALAAAVQGNVAASLVGATLPAGLEAKIGLDGGRWFRSLLSQDERIAVTCSALSLQFTNGVGQVRQLALETPHLVVSGSGQVNLPAKTFELWLVPRRKQSALLALDRWLHLRGGTRGNGGLDVATVEPKGPAPASACKPPA